MMPVQNSLELWMPQVLGRYVNEDWEPKTQGYGAQCWDIPANWSKYLGLPVINTGGPGRWPGWAGNMADAFPQTPAVAAAYEKLPPSTTVQAGDILVWDDSYFWYPQTHVAVGVRDLDAQLLCVSQNSTAAQPGNPYPQWTTGPATLQHLPRKGLLAIIRPRTGGTIQPQGTTTKEDELSAAEVKEIKDYIHALLIGGYTSAGEDRAGIADDVRAIKGRTDRYLDAPTSAVPGKVWGETVTRGGKQISVKQELADSKSLAEKAAATIAASVALAKNDGLTSAQITAAVQAALSDVSVDFTLNGAK